MGRLIRTQRYDIQVHVFEYIRELDSFATGVDRAVGEGKVRAVMGVHILRLQSLVAVSIGCPGAVVTHLDEFCHNKNIQDNDEIEENVEKYQNTRVRFCILGVL